MEALARDDANETRGQLAFPLSWAMPVVADALTGGVVATTASILMAHRAKSISE